MTDVRFWRIRYPFLWERYPEDFCQTLILSGLAKASPSSLLEHLAHDLGWRRAKVDGKRVWMGEFNWLCRGQHRQGAPAGNQNHRGKHGGNQHTKRADAGRKDLLGLITPA